MSFKKQALSPILVIIAMVILLFPKFTGEEPMDLLSYLAVALIIASIVNLIMIYRQSNYDL